MKNNNYNYRLFAFIASAIFIILLMSPEFSNLLFARPGGGSSFSGGGGGYSGGGGGDGGLIILILSQLPPQISIPLIIAIIVFRIYQERKKKRGEKPIISKATQQNIQRANIGIHNQIETLKAEDQNFSKVLFLDFASSIYKKYFALYGKADFKNLAPFLSDTEIQASITSPKNQSFTEVIIGSINISSIQFHSNIIGIAVDIESNFTRVVNDKRTRYSVVERWYFNRKRGILSADPEKMQKLSCPNCGASSDFTDAGKCNSCDTFINKGEMQWFLKTHNVLSQEVFNTTGIAHYEPERGTNLPTLYQSNLVQNSNIFAQRHKNDFPQWKKSFMNDVVATYFFKIYEAWSNNNLNNSRNLVTDRLHESFMFWIDAYKTQGLTNKLDDISIRDIEMCSIETDKFYESVTVRVFAQSLDYVIDKNMKVIGGSARKPRSFSEYWTFIRRTGVEKDTFDYNTCPSCGAPSDKIGMSGVCEYCGNKISNGDFSWVLAIISQDEVYKG